MSASIYWYDFETFGNDPRRDRASQFAGVRTDEDLQIVGEPLVMYCKPADDFLPSPMASLVTGIAPQRALAEGVAEVEFIRRINQEFSQPATCVAGYNSIRFDDEVTRQLLYRNLMDPYAREWQNGNSRWDIIDMVRLCAATRPDGVQWPRKDDGSVSFRLDQLTLANGIEHSGAHDAQADVVATIELAALIKSCHPKLYQYVYGLRDKRQVMAQLDLEKRRPVLHASVMYPSRLGCIALVMPICAHPTNSNGVVVYDLRQDPRDWLSASVEEIRRRVFSPGDQLADDEPRIGLKTLHANKCPVVVAPGVLQPARASLYEIDLARCRENWELLDQDVEARRKIVSVFREEHHATEDDPDFMIYSGGFFNDYDRALMQTVHDTAAADLGRLDLPFKDGRLKQMLYRFRARNYPETLNKEEALEWDRFRRQRLSDPTARERFQTDLAEARERADSAQHELLDALQNYVDSLQS